MNGTAPQQHSKPEQLGFDFLVPARIKGKKLLTTSEAAWCIGRERSFVQDLCDAGRLEVHRDSASGLAESLKSRRITMRSVMLYLASTAEYESGPRTEHIIAVIDSISDRASLDKILQAALKRRSSI
jgi:hypothetical protein